MIDTKTIRTQQEIIAKRNMALPKKWILGIDAGFSSLKGFAPNKYFCFPSFAHKLDSELQVVNEKDILYRDESGTYLVGASAQMEQRCCGESEGKYITFGAKEKWDVQRWAIYVSERNEEKLPIYLYGQSMGAAAVLMASGYRLPSEVKGLIADCGFQSMERQMRDMADNWFHLHYIPLLLKEMDCLCHFVAGFRMKDADTTEAMKRNTRPVLFFHGEKDTYVYPNNSFQNYMLCKAPKELVIVQGARHLCSAYADPELYQRTVMEFFEKYDGSNSEK